MFILLFLIKKRIGSSSCHFGLKASDRARVVIPACPHLAAGKRHYISFRFLISLLIPAPPAMLSHVETKWLAVFKNRGCIARCVFSSSASFIVAATIKDANKA
jgi:hypothetical protein